MKLFAVVVLVFLGGCASRPSLEELKTEARTTGDWSQVEHREMMDRKMGRIDGEDKCDKGYISHCEVKGEREVCGCISPLDREAFNN